MEKKRLKEHERTPRKSIASARHLYAHGTEVVRCADAASGRATASLKLRGGGTGPDIFQKGRLECQERAILGSHHAAPRVQAANHTLVNSPSASWLGPRPRSQLKYGTCFRNGHRLLLHCLHVEARTWLAVWNTLYKKIPSDPVLRGPPAEWNLEQACQDLVSSPSSQLPPAKPTSPSPASPPNPLPCESSQMRIGTGIGRQINYSSCTPYEAPFTQNIVNSLQGLHPGLAILNLL